MFKRMIAAVMMLAMLICSTYVEAAESNNWLIYWYICGSNLESEGHSATRNIAEMQQVKLPPNVKVLINAGGTTQWHHPTLKAGGDGIYLYGSKQLEKLADWNANMGDPNTLANFLKFGEENIRFGKENVVADRRIIIFSNHGGLGGVCYDDNYNQDGLTYDELKDAFASVYVDSPETPPFELIGFDACMASSYELANSLSNFSHYMLGAEPSIYGPQFKDWIAALAKNPSMTGVQVGKVFIDSTMQNYSDDKRLTHSFSVIDLTKMPELREAYEAYFDEALKRSDKEVGFLSAFARAAESRTTNRFSNLYTDLGLLAKNTKEIMPKESDNLLKAIDHAVVYNKRGAYLNSKGISTYYPYISSEFIPVTEKDSGENVNATYNQFIDDVLKQNANYSSQKELYVKLLSLKPDENANLSVPLEQNSNGHFVANLTPEKIENTSSITCFLVPVKRNDNSILGFELGGSILTSVDDLKIDWKKGTVTENFRAVKPLFDGHEITMMPLVSGRGHTLYKIPILYNDSKLDLIVRYDTSTKKYSIIGFGNTVENGVVRSNMGKPQAGVVITPIHLVLSDDLSNAIGIFNKDPIIDPNTGKNIYWKWVKGAPFVYTRDSAITTRQITNGDYIYAFLFSSPSGYFSMSQPALISIERGQVIKWDSNDIAEIAE